MIETFNNTDRVKKTKGNSHMNVLEAVNPILDNTHDHHVFAEYIFNMIIIEAWNNAAIHSLDMSKEDFIDLLRQSGWHYDQQKHYWAKDKPQLELLMTSG